MDICVIELSETSEAGPGFLYRLLGDMPDDGAEAIGARMREMRRDLARALSGDGRDGAGESEEPL